MDLNLYLGLPRSPIRRGSDLTSDLARASIPLRTEEIAISAEMSGYIPASDSHSHTPYSPTRASYAPNLPPVEPLDDPNEETKMQGLEYAPYCPPLPPYGLAPSSSALNSTEPNSSSRREYCPYSPSYIVSSPNADQAGVVPLDPGGSEPVGHAPYTPQYVTASLNGQDDVEPVVEEGNNHVEHVPYSPSYVPSSPLPQPSAQASEALALEDGDPHVPYSPSYIPVSLTPQVHDDSSNGGSSLPAVSVSLYEATMQTNESASAQDGPSRRENLQSPEIRLQRLIESSRRCPIRRFRSTVPYRPEPNFGMSSLHMEDRLLRDIMSMDPPALNFPMHKAIGDSHVANDSEEEKEEQGIGAANFECNVCLDMAKEPVVTSCGHLFCWPCLYKWLHLYCDYKECPVCKGEVTESNITPIYGRGRTETGAEKKSGEEGDSSLLIPPRPDGCRHESFRQRHPRLIPRRLGESFISWGRILDEEIWNGNRVDGREPSQTGIFNGPNGRLLTRLMASHPFQREESSENGLNLAANGLSRDGIDPASNSQNGNSHVDGTQGGQRSSSFWRDRIGFLHRVALYNLPSSAGFAALTAHVSDLLERTVSNGNNSGAFASANPQNPEPLLGQAMRGATPVADQASASSTMAVIQGDAGVLDASAEPNGAGSSRSFRRRRRNGTSSSLDVDGGVHHARKRRRLN